MTEQQERVQACSDTAGTADTAAPGADAQQPTASDAATYRAGAGTPRAEVGGRQPTPGHLLVNPFPVLGVHPEVSRIAESIDDWLADKRMFDDSEGVRRAKAAEYARLAGCTLPRGNAVVVGLFGRFNAFFFDADERFVEVPAREGTVSAAAIELLSWGRIVEHARFIPAPAAGGPRGGLYDLSMQVRQHASPAQVAQLNRGFLQYIAGAACEAALLAQERMPPLDAYLALRYDTIAKHWVLPWVEIAGGYELSAALRHDPELDRMTSALTHAVAWANDIVSCEREVGQWAKSPNLPSVLAHQRHCELQEGMAEAVVMYDRQIDHALSLLTDLRKRADAMLTRYLDDLEILAGGWLNWLQSATRYQDTTR
ncbi:terpene synthase family protein [Streptomyces sp. NPDC102406]|uniref:terpene synthase family protein n=1 Tax=Streptomyces sp. NPDC102406 TaxID=3366171 RepID=UPI0038225F24